jgi:ferritin
VNIASYFDADSLPQLAAFFYRQAEEEKMHAMKFVHYIVEAGGQVRVPAVGEPKFDFQSTKEAVQAAFNWEVKVTKQINDLMDLAIKQNDHIGQDFLRWFVSEQLEEISTMDTLLKVVDRAGENILWVEDFLARNPIVPEGNEAE